jgi:hypothetical protein
MGKFCRIFPDVHVRNEPYPIQFGSGDQVIEILAFWDTALRAQQIGLAQPRGVSERCWREPEPRCGP